MQCPDISAPSPSKIQHEVNSALPTSSKRRRLVSPVWKDFERVEVNGEHWARCNHCRKHFSGSSKSGTTHLKNHLSRCSAIQSGESSKQRRLVSKVWNDFERVEVDGERQARCNHCRKHFSGSSKSGTTHLKNHLQRCSALKSSTLWKMAIPMSTSTLNSAFSIETTTINPILNGLDPNIAEALVSGKEWLDNPMRMDNEHSPELTHTSFVSAGASLSLETHEKHAPSTANMELMLTNHWVDNEHSPEITQNSIVFPRASLSFEPQQKHAPSSANVELMVANLSSTLCPEPGPTGHSSFVSAGTFSSLELNEKHAPSSANTEFMLASLSSISCSEPLPIDHTSFVSVGASLSLESQEKLAPFSANSELMLANHSSTSSPWPLATVHTSFVSEHAPSSANSELMLANHSSTSCPEPLPTAHSSFVSAGTYLSLEAQEILGTGMSAKMWEVPVEHAQTSVIEKRMFLYSPPSSQQKNGVVFNVMGQVMGLLLECQYVPIDKLSETEKVDALVISAINDWEEVVSFDDEASLVGSSSLLTNVYTASLPRTESSNIGKLLASHKIGAFDYTQLSETEKVDAHNLFISAFNHLEEVVSFDDEASLVGSSSLLTNVYTASLPRTESSNIGKLLASHKIGAFDYTQQSAAIGRARKTWTTVFILIQSLRRDAISIIETSIKQVRRHAKRCKDTVESAQTCVLEKRMFLYSPPSSPDIISSICSVGGSSGFDDYDLPSVDGMGLRYDQASSFLESMKHSFDDNDLKFFLPDL